MQRQIRQQNLCSLMIQIKRVYDLSVKEDAARFLVRRLGRWG
jgi:hypothetical protein